MGSSSVSWPTAHLTFNTLTFVHCVDSALHIYSWFDYGSVIYPYIGYIIQYMDNISYYVLYIQHEWITDQVGENGHEFCRVAPWGVWYVVLKQWHFNSAKALQLKKVRLALSFAKSTTKQEQTQRLVHLQCDLVNAKSRGYIRRPGLCPRQRSESSQWIDNTLFVILALFHSAGLLKASLSPVAPTGRGHHQVLRQDLQAAHLPPHPSLQVAEAEHVQTQVPGLVSWSLTVGTSDEFPYYFPWFHLHRSVLQEESFRIVC